MSPRSEYHRQRYLAAKASGLCTGCMTQQARPGRTVCAVCTKARKRRFGARKSRQAKWQVKRIIAGLCSLCGTQPLHTKTMCVECAAKVKARSAAYRAWSAPKIIVTNPLTPVSSRTKATKRDGGSDSE